MDGGLHRGNGFGVQSDAQRGEAVIGQIVRDAMNLASGIGNVPKLARSTGSRFGHHKEQAGAVR